MPMPGFSGGAKCEGGVCKLTSCSSGYRVSDDGLSCIKLDCTEGETKCEAANIYRCNAAGTWVFQSACTTSVTNGYAVCSGNSCSFGCNSGFSSNGRICCKAPYQATLNHDSSSSCHYTCGNFYRNCDSDPSDCETLIVDNNHCGNCTTKCTGGTHCESTGTDAASCKP